MLEIASPDGDEGYPGDFILRGCYTLHQWGLSVQLTATTSAPTPVNILHHSYFNLDGKGEIAGHVLQIEGDTYLEFDTEGLPTRRRLSVAGSGYDFSSPRKLVPHERFDTSFVVSPEPLAHPAHVAMLVSSAGDLKMKVRTTEPGLHFYNGFAAAAPVPGLEGRPHLPASGICLEATRFNDAFNLPHLGDVILRPGQTYNQRTEFIFEPLRGSSS